MSTENVIFWYEKALYKEGAARDKKPFDQKQRRVDDSDQCLKMIKRNKPEFLRRYLTMYETWVQNFTPKSNRRSFDWTAHDEPATKRGKTVGWQGYGVCILGCAWNNFHCLP
ncbi:hypothetical protein GWI33_009331 [Rhynchophorus ferrugineus]|uniref:Uncharacterized protein n=1 Tax=Rhynchophorus ferrugineus TaxID=354439 RepID=A0A834MG68_RHYFE|nr:hypothetical protein GWI33_009331 [Rhynchophorus ferrugineus]